MRCVLPVLRRPVRLATLCLLAAVPGVAVPGVASSAEPVALRVESFTVAPSSGPLAFVDVKNLQEKPYHGALAMKVPQGWRVDPPKQEINLAPRETRRVPFTIEKGLTLEANCYPIEVSATGAGTTVVRKQDVACASAPYFKPTIDGDPGEWTDAIPASFATAGKQTTISTYWNRRQFCLLIAVEEDELIRHAPGPAATFDAVQLALSPQDSKTGTSPDQQATRFEFLFVATDSGPSARCFQLATPGMKLAATQATRRLEPLESAEAKVAVSRKDATTYYECSIPFSALRGQIRPGEGREFMLSVLVHDPDGTGIRDWGQAAGLWPPQRNALAWSRWQGAQWANKPPFDNKLRWGLCSSKY